jgi:glycosyltransferase involved in cell wall biosynthesis
VTGEPEPKVAVATPVYNGEATLERCIESVLEQTHRNLEYTIVDNCSTDATPAIAKRYAARDPRIRIHRNAEFLDVIGNHNNAFALVCDRGEYVKLVGADDWLFPGCLEAMVSLAEAHPTVGMVSSYVLYGTRVAWDGLPYPSTFLKGRDACRMYLLEDIKAFGGPSASLLRSSVVCARQPFYKPGRYNGDTEAYLDLLREHDFGFVHQVLSFKRAGQESRTTHALRRINPYAASNVEELVRYGPAYLSPVELEQRLAQELDSYYRFLAEIWIRRPGRDVWRYHRDRMRLLGTPIRTGRLARYVAAAILDRLLNPKRTLEGLARAVRDARRSNDATHP